MMNNTPPDSGTPPPKEELRHIQTAQICALKKGILHSADTFTPEGEPTGHIAHIIPNAHRVTSWYSDQERDTRTMHSVTDAQKTMFRFLCILKESRPPMSIFVEALAKTALTTIPQPPITIAIGEQNIDVRSSEGQALLLKRDDILMKLLTHSSPIAAYNLIGGIDFKPILPQEIMVQYTQMRETYTSEDFDMFAKLNRPGNKITLTIDAVRKFVQISLDYEELQCAMDNAFVEGLLKEGKGHVQQLMCGVAHMRNVKSALLKRGSVVTVSATAQGNRWKDHPMPTETQSYIFAKNFLDENDATSSPRDTPSQH